MQYNSKEGWGGFIVDILKAKREITSVSESTTKLFEKYKDKNLSNTIQQVIKLGTFENFFKKNNIVEESFINFLLGNFYFH